MREWLQHIWYRPQTPPLLLRLLAGLFALLIKLRYFCYRHQLFASTRLDVPVIVVGNLTVGGTGKTPLVVYLAQALMAQGIQVAVMASGYGGALAKHKKFATPVDGNMSAADVGDEALLMAQQLNCPVWVGRNRGYVGQQLMAQQPYTQVIICDDGLQHYALARDIEIVLFDGARGLGNGYLLPAGPLREQPTRLACADYMVVNGTPMPSAQWLAALTAMSLPVATMQLKPQDLYALHAPQRRQSLQALKGKLVHAVAGIGHPMRFFERLREDGLTIQPHAFADHHAYVEGDFAGFALEPIIMTEKDAVKCRQMQLPNAWVLPVTADLPAELLEWLLIQLQSLTNQPARGRHG
jgi:tetraacyldisaccharide 4'-kinase